jgi:hypothetical protein
VKGQFGDFESIPKIDRHVAWEILAADVPYGKLRYLPTVRSIPDDLWDEIDYCFHRKNQIIP